MSRAKIVLAAVDGKSNKQIAEQLGVSQAMAENWPNRFAEQRLAGIEKNLPRRGRNPHLCQDIQGLERPAVRG